MNTDIHIKFNYGCKNDRIKERHTNTMSQINNNGITSPGSNCKFYKGKIT